MRQHGFYAEGICGMGTDLVAEISKLAPKVLERFPQAIFFGGQLVFPQETFLTGFLHNYAVFAAQRQFYQEGLPLLILPIRVWQGQGLDRRSQQRRVRPRGLKGRGDN